MIIGYNFPLSSRKFNNFIQINKTFFKNFIRYYFEVLQLQKQSTLFKHIPIYITLFLFFLFRKIYFSKKFIKTLDTVIIPKSNDITQTLTTSALDIRNHLSRFAQTCREMPPIISP